MHGPPSAVAEKIGHQCRKRLGPGALVRSVDRPSRNWIMLAVAALVAGEQNLLASHSSSNEISLESGVYEATERLPGPIRSLQVFKCSPGSRRDRPGGNLGQRGVGIAEAVDRQIGRAHV